MSKLKEIENSISQLSKEELAGLRKWFEEFTEQAWDKQIEKDIKEGKLDKLSTQVISEFEAGQCKEI